jgi:16S rRNA (guanine527-N7)-methyltransferase
VTVATTEALLETLRLAQRLGFFGAGSIAAAVEHAGHFVAAIDEQARTVVDLGSGGGLPGLVIAEALPRLQVTLVERRQTRADFLQRAVSRLQLGGRVEVQPVDVRRLVDDPARAGRFDVVTARGFAQPAVVVEIAAALLCPGGQLIASDPPSKAGAGRWAALPPERFGLELIGSDGVVSVLRRSRSLPRDDAH